MTRSADVHVDVVILGGGIAGLWLLDRLHRDGLSALLLEADQLGAGQSVASQGIIHGGAKYTFGFMLDSAVRELRTMPAVWRASVEGSASPDLDSSRILSTSTYMWVPKQFGGGLLGAFSRWVMRSRVRALARSDWPEGLRSDRVAGAVYALDELVLDVPSVLEAIQAKHRDRIRRIPDLDALRLSPRDGMLDLGDMRLCAQRIVLTAGAGNEGLLARAGLGEVATQRRPLHQVLVAGMRQPLFAHCVGRNTKPLATVTAHPGVNADWFWNVGGLIAEEGVDECPEALIDHARKELPRLFPAADFGTARFATFRVDRAEGAVAGGRRPGGPVVESRDRVVVAWPTKLALAPALADRVTHELRRQGVAAGESDIGAVSALSEPAVALPPWKQVEAWS